jgi:hypothetical protein
MGTLFDEYACTVGPHGHSPDCRLTELLDRLEGTSFGWHPNKKKTELFHKHGRFILARTKESRELVAIASFRFDAEPNDHYGVDDVLYLCVPQLQIILPH